MIWDLITIGGGAAGFFGAITHKEHGGGSTLILEKGSQILSKVRISGGGRCNVTHACFDPKELSTHYPRGEKALIGPLHRWDANDTISWFESKGVTLKTEDDGRMFPSSNDSQTIVHCLTETARDAGIEIRTHSGITNISKPTKEALFTLKTEKGDYLQANKVLLATGGTRSPLGARLAEQLDHELAIPVPSLFTFKMSDPRIDGLQGLSVDRVTCKIVGSTLNASGPLLITHWGVSGPGILRLSAWGARELAAINYHFILRVNWLPSYPDLPAELQKLRKTWGKRQLHSRCPFDEIPKRLWARLLTTIKVAETQTWSQLSKAQAKELSAQLTQAEFQVAGKSTNKDEFVTCGGVLLKDIQLKTMESRRCQGLYFAGEVMDVDAITGGFNFQHAWTSGHHAGKAMAQR